MSERESKFIPQEQEAGEQHRSPDYGTTETTAVEPSEALRRTAAEQTEQQQLAAQKVRAEIGAEHERGTQEIERTQIEKLLEAEAAALENFFGYKIELPPLPAEVTPEKLEAWAKLGFNIHYLPNEELGKDRDLPGWQFKPRNMQLGLIHGTKFFDNVRDGLMPADTLRLPGKWVLVDGRDKPNCDKERTYGENDPVGETLAELRQKGLVRRVEGYEQEKTSRFNVAAPELHDQRVLDAFAQKLGVKAGTVRLPKLMEWNYLGNNFYRQWGTNRTAEWFNDTYRGDKGYFRGGNSTGGDLRQASGLTANRWSSPKWRRDSLGFRLLAELS